MRKNGQLGREALQHQTTSKGSHALSTCCCKSTVVVLMMIVFCHYQLILQSLSPIMAVMIIDCPTQAFSIPV